MAKSLMDYIFRRLAIDYLPTETRQALGINTASERSATLDAGSYAVIAESPKAEEAVVEAPVVIELKVEEVQTESARQVHSSAELFDLLQGTESDAPLCFSCGIKMRPSGSCHVCEGCGSTSGCS
jgi:ribonucleoside-diphosphate reductase alpha chain